ncbi:hypothetical protein AMJ57_00830 [Parcubacteria bacterium SG8_24]|nr:MAG: hypothetical protein AMJ57_00830 [Parcubacteria bacterium SG8_24]
MIGRSTYCAIVTCCVLSLACCAAAGPAAAAPPKVSAPTDAEARLSDRFMAATALLYAQEFNGTMRMYCTATAFERDKKVYRFATAAHCVAEDDTLHKEVELEAKTWYLTFDEDEAKRFYRAKIVAAGYQHRGDDFAVVEVTLDRWVPIIPLAKSDPHTGEDVINIASPGGLGKQLFRGHVSKAKLSRPVVARSINWKNATLLQMNAGGGSSGSAIVSTGQRGIVAFLVGSIGGGDSLNTVAIPIGKFKSFWERSRTGKYKWFDPKKAEEGDSADPEDEDDEEDADDGFDRLGDPTPSPK